MSTQGSTARLDRERIRRRVAAALKGETYSVIEMAHDLERLATHPIWEQQNKSAQTVEAEVDVIPRIGEKIGVRQPGGMEDTVHFALDYVVDVRHYLIPKHEIRVLTSSRR